MFTIFCQLQLSSAPDFKFPTKLIIQITFSAILHRCIQAILALKLLQEIV